MSEEKKSIALPIVGNDSSPTSTAASSEHKTREQGGDIMSEIAHEVHAHKLVLYMKGTPQTPQCGFSARAVQILQSYGVPLHTVNILADQEKRQAIKAYSNWPTIPQVYIGGEFQGGSDILMQMHDNGELERELKAAFEPKA